jgi:lysyl-tRNA synthetase class 2
MLYRSHGKLAFAKILDSTNQIQLMFHRDQCKIIKTIKNQDWKMIDEAVTELDFSESETWKLTAYKFMEKMVDIGDFIWVKWEVFKTHKGELTIFVSEFKFLSKAIRPLPEKFHWISDQEDLYRKRYLDMTMNPESYERFLFKSKFYKTLREFYFKHWFTEIQTPILDNAASW